MTKPNLQITQKKSDPSLESVGFLWGLGLL